MPQSGGEPSLELNAAARARCSYDAHRVNGASSVEVNALLDSGLGDTALSEKFVARNHREGLEVTLLRPFEGQARVVSAFSQEGTNRHSSTPVASGHGVSAREYLVHGAFPVVLLGSSSLGII